jgi:hypothetical protein
MAPPQNVLPEQYIAYSTSGGRKRDFLDCDVGPGGLVCRPPSKTIVENRARQAIDTHRCSHYPRLMPMVDQHIRIGQVWKKNGTEETFLVTKLYNEALSTIAVLRPTGAATESMIRVRVERRGDTQALPGYSMAQENERT